MKIAENISSRSGSHWMAFVGAALMAACSSSDDGLSRPGEPLDLGGQAAATAGTPASAQALAGQGTLAGAASSDGVDGEGTLAPTAGAVTEDVGATPVAGGDAALTGLAAVEDRCGTASSTSMGVSRLRRISRTTYDNAIADLLGRDLQLASNIEADESVGPFAINLIAPVTDLVVEQYQRAAEAVAIELRPSVGELVDCELDETGCVGSLIQGFGRGVFRRALTAEESADYQALYELARQSRSAEDSVVVVLETLFQSPNFLYFVEQGETGAPSTEPQRLRAEELATRLALFYWDSVPDAQLLDLGDALLSPDTLSQQVARMLGDERAARAVGLFHERLLGVGKVVSASKDPQQFPAFDDALAHAMVDETRAFSDYVVRRGDGLLATLLTGGFTVASDDLLSLYGATRPAGAGAAEPVTLDSTQRAGLLTQAGFLAAHAHADQTSPVHRGIAVRENLLCQPLPSPPANVNNVAPPVSPATTTRQRLAKHVEDPSCAECHLLIDPVGLGFENYDAIGGFRSTDGGQPVDAVGEVRSAGDDLAGSFDGAVELAHRLAASERVTTCVTAQWLRFALGRLESRDDECALAELQRGFINSEGDTRALLLGIASSDVFTHVRSLGAEEERP